MNIAYTARKSLIRLGKFLPFLLCFLVWLSYCESLVALLFERYIVYGDYLILNTPISFAIGMGFEYDILIVFIALIISIAIESCKWNLLAIAYLALHIMQKCYFDFPMDEWLIITICAINIVVTSFFIIKLKVLRT